MNIKVRRIGTEDIPKLIEFNVKMYQKRDRIKEIISFLVLKNPFSQKLHSYISYLEDNSIIGQIILVPTQFRFNNEIKDATWGIDYIVDEMHRGSIAGVQLCKKTLKENLHFGIGLSEISLKMHLIFNEDIVGKMTKYIKRYKVSSFVNTEKKIETDQNRFPKKIKVGNTYLYKVNESEEIKSDNGYWNGKEVLEFSRNSDFLKWRFFNHPNNYIFYKIQDRTNNQKSAYFVLRNIVWKNQNCFLLVDYRFNSNSDFDTILKAIDKLSSLTKVSATITGSTLESLEKVLKRNGYLPFEEKMDIVTNFKNISSVSNNILVTIADSDTDYLYGNNNW